MKKRNRKLSNGTNRARAVVRATEAEAPVVMATVDGEKVEVVTAAGTSEGVKKSWESRHAGIGSHSDARSALAQMGYDTSKGTFRDFGMGLHATTESYFTHPDGHKATVQKQGASKKVHVFIDSASEEHHKEAGEVMRKAKGKANASGTEETTETVKAKAVVHCKSSGSPIQAKKVWEVDKPIDFMWMPGGVHTIHASYGRGEDDQRPIELTVNCTEDCAKAVQASFEAIRSASPRRPPFICIEHSARERAGEPQSFEWRNDPEPAIYCRCLPSALGATNVNGKIHTSFSPTFDTDAEYHKMTCTECRKTPSVCACESGAGWVFPDGVRGSKSLPAKVTAPDVQSVGSLTNWNAFRDMLPIAARENKAVEAAGNSEGARKGWLKRGHRVHFDLHRGEAGKDDWGDQWEGAKKHHGQSAEVTSTAIDPVEHSGSHESGYYDIKFDDGHEMEAISGVHLKKLGGSKTKASSTEPATETVKASEKTTTSTQTDKPTVAAILASKTQTKSSAETVMAKLRQQRLGIAPSTVAATEPPTVSKILARMGQTGRPPAQTNEGTEQKVK